jgi:hypothetical protein
MRAGVNWHNDALAGKSPFILAVLWKSAGLAGNPTVIFAKKRPNTSNLRKIGGGIGANFDKVAIHSKIEGEFPVNSLVWGGERCT